jgi:3-deoxy-D-manno-octulosonic-acid transferase
MDRWPFSTEFNGRLLASLIRVVKHTSPTVYEPRDLKDRLRAHQPFIFAMWHGQFMMLADIAVPDVEVSAMVSRHGDGELTADVLQRFGIGLIRGAGAGQRKKDRGGAHALRAALRALEAGSVVAMTADVPLGEARRAGDGIVMLARLSGRPIIPVAAATSRFLALRTWSRMTVNLPFSKLAYVAGDPIFVPAHADERALEQARLDVERSMNAVTARAYELAGAEPARLTPAKMQRAPHRYQ